MNENSTRLILQRLPVILAVTAASYGLPAQAAQSTGSKSAERNAANSHAAPVATRTAVAH